MALPLDAYWRVIAILEARGVKWSLASFSLEDDERGKIVLRRWDSALGKKPTDEEIRNTAPYDKPNPDDAVDVAIEAATTLAQLKSALQGRVKGRE